MFPEINERTWKNRRQPDEYATCLVASCKHSNWWYASLVGMEFFCRLRFKNYGYGRLLYEAVPVRLTSTTVDEARSFDADDIILI